MSKLITSSLHGGIKWARSAPPDWRAPAFESLSNMLAREWSEPKGSAKRGIEFEDSIYRVLNAKVLIKDIKCTEKFKKILQYLNGGVFQKKAKKFLIIDGVEYCIYAKMDVWFPEKIIDIKTSGKEWNQYSEGNYLSSFQHRLYCYVTGIDYFEYYVVLFDGDEGRDILDTHIISYGVDDFKKLEAEIFEGVRGMIRFLKMHPKLYKMYNEKYCRQGN